MTSLGKGEDKALVFNNKTQTRPIMLPILPPSCSRHTFGRITESCLK